MKVAGRRQRYKGTNGRVPRVGDAPPNRIRLLLNAAEVTEAEAAAAIWPDGGCRQSQLNGYKNLRRVPSLAQAWVIVAGLRVALGRPDLRFEDVFPEPSHAALVRAGLRRAA